MGGGGIRSHIQQFLKTLKSLEMHLVTKVPYTKTKPSLKLEYLLYVPFFPTLVLPLSNEKTLGFVCILYFTVGDDFLLTTFIISNI